MGPVFCYVSYVRASGVELDWELLRGKCICWGIKGTKIMIENSWLQNEENQLYWFSVYMTDDGVHGVPNMAGFMSIIHIFRQARPGRFLED